MADSPKKYAGTLSRTVATHDERRKIPRYVVNADSEVEEPNVRAKITGRMTDLGLGGCYVDALTSFPVGTLVMVRMTREDLPFEAGAKVVFSKPGLGMGLAFSDLEPEQQTILSQWISELSGCPPAQNPQLAKSPPPNLFEGTEKGGNREVLHNLVKILMRKGMLTQSEFEDLLRELEKDSRVT